MSASIKIIHCALCDDVRLEVTNKEIIIGVYSAGITVPMLPWIAELCIWLNVIWSGEGRLDIEIRVLNPAQQPVGGVTGGGNAIFSGIESTLTFRHLMIAADMDGPYTIQWRPAGGSWETIRLFNIFALSQTPPSAS